MRWVLFLLLSSLVARAEEPPAEYRRLIDEALREFEARDFEESLALFERAYKVHATARVLRGMGKVQFEMREYAKSLDSLERALQSTEDPLTGGLREDAEALRVRALRYVSNLSFTVRPESAALLVDGRPLKDKTLRIDLGSHVVEVSATGYHPLRRTVDVEGGKDQALSLVMVPVQRPGRTMLWTGVALDIAFLGALMGSVGWFVDRSDAVDRCALALSSGVNCTNGAKLASERDLSVGGLAVSTVGLAASAIVTGLAVKKLRPRTDKLALACAPVLGGLSCTVGGTW